MGKDLKDGCWLFGLVYAGRLRRRGAYPCELASLARVPFRPERGRT